MTKQLKKSTKDLANLEREIAWKEMAKQVAHEIKNPLTPMKLSVQHLKAAYQDKSEKFDEIFKKVTDTLINQVETLKKISTEFSSLAKMPRLNVERINLIEIIEQAVNLFADEKTEFITSFSESGVFIEADSDNLKRTLINLIRNSIQAEAGKIEIEVNNSRDVVQLILTDNGLGVPEEIKNKIFDINFSTKKEGMGLGLTLAKRFLENTGADIELADSTGKGASFIITFNRAKSA
jgi:nitrogen fixation/metabolism regulation signal transduction histidine kinase